MTTPNNTTTVTVDTFLADVLKSVLPPDNLPPNPTQLITAGAANGDAPATPAPATPAEAKTARERERVQHFLQLLGLLLVNLDYAKRDQGNGHADEPSPDRQIYFVDKKTFADLLARVNELIALQLNEVFHQPALRDLEG